MPCVYSSRMVKNYRICPIRIEIIHNYFLILSLLLRELIKGEKFASLLNIHGGDIRVVPTHLV